MTLKKLDASEEGSGTVLIDDYSMRVDPDTPYVTLYQKTGDVLTVTVDDGTGHPVTTHPSETGLEYTPAQGWRYAWSTGQETTLQYWKTTGSSSWLGIDALAADPPDQDWDRVIPMGTVQQLDSGTYFYKDTNTTDETNSYIWSGNQIDESTSPPVWRDVNHWTESTWYGKKTYYTTMVKEQPVEDVWSHSIKADTNIDIDFIGNAAGAITVNSTSTGRVLLDGPIVNPTGTTQITSAATIEQTSSSAYVGGLQIVLNAQNGIGSSAVTLQTDLASGGTYKYDSSEKSTTSLIAGNDVRVTAGYANGGTPGVIYRYKGNSAALDLATQNYADTSLWDPVLSTSNGSTAMTAGKQVMIASSYGGGGTAGAIYEYLGSSTTLNLGGQNYTNSTLWRKVETSPFSSTDTISINPSDSVLVVAGNNSGGDAGSIYKYVGTSPVALNLAAQNYANTTLWQKITQLPSLQANSSSGDINLDNITGDLDVSSVTAGTESALHNVSLSAEGSILVAKTSATTWASGLIQGGSIDLDAQSGTLGATGHPLLLFSGTSLNDSINAQAQGDIYLEEKATSSGARNDMRLYQAISNGGDVSIIIDNGWLIDANSNEQRDPRTYDELSQMWDNMQLTGTGAEQKIEDTINSANALKVQEYETYWSYRSQDAHYGDGSFSIPLSAAETASYTQYYTAQANYHSITGVDGTANTISFADAHGFTTGQAVVYTTGGDNALVIEGGGSLVDGNTYYVIATADPTKLKLATSQANALAGVAINLATDTDLAKTQGLKLANSADITAYVQNALTTLTNARDTEYRTLDAEYGSLGSSFNASWVNPASPHDFLGASEEAAIRASIKVWTPDELLYALGAGLLKPITSTQVSDESPNITGRNVSITTNHGGVGISDGVRIINIPASGAATLSTDDRVALTAAERADVTYVGISKTAQVNFTTSTTSGGTITRTDGGSWLTDGFQAGMSVQINGTFVAVDPVGSPGNTSTPMRLPMPRSQASTM